MKEGPLNPTKHHWQNKELSLAKVNYRKCLYIKDNIKQQFELMPNSGHFKIIDHKGEGQKRRANFRWKIEIPD